MRVNRALLISSVASIALHLLLYKCVSPWGGVGGGTSAMASTMQWTLTTIVQSDQTDSTDAPKIDGVDLPTEASTEPTVQQPGALASSKATGDNGTAISLFPSPTSSLVNT